MHAMMPALDLVGERLGTHGQRIGVRHLEHRSDAAHHRRQRAALKVFLVGEAGLAEMHLGVDHARQEMQAPAVDHLARRRARQVADRRETAGANAEIAHAFAVMVDDRAALEDQIVACQPCWTASGLGLRPVRQRLRSAASSGKRLSKQTPENRHAGSTSSRSRRGQGRRRRRPALSQRAGDRRYGQGRAGQAALCGAAHATGQDHRRLHHRRGAGRGRRRLLPRLPAGTRPGAGGKAELLQAARQGDLRGPLGRARGDGGLGRNRPTANTA